MTDPSTGQPPEGPEPPDARPLRSDAERNRERILRAAAEVFTTRGLQASLDDVARHAGVGVGTVYRRFPGKEALAEALFEQRMEALAGLAEAAMAEPDSWHGLVWFLEKATEMMATDRGLREVLMYASYGQAQAAKVKERMRPIVTALVRRAQGDGKLRADFMPTDVPLIEFMLSAAAGYAEHVRPHIWRRYLSLIIDGLRPCRQDVTPLREPALTPDEIAQVVVNSAARRCPGPA